MVPTGIERVVSPVRREAVVSPYGKGRYIRQQWEGIVDRMFTLYSWTDVGLLRAYDSGIYGNLGLIDRPREDVEICTLT